MTPYATMVSDASDVVLGIDPSPAATGWALVDVHRRRLASCGTLKRATPYDIQHFVEQHHRDITAAAIEDQYLAKSPKVLAQLAAFRGRWMQELDVSSVPVTLVAPQTWQAAILSGLVGSRSPRKQRKKASMLYVRRLWGLDPPDDNAADAACIAMWLAGRRALKVR
jgi:Holliday junction resolvasome RuvABC endonuclease subunit